MGKRLFGKVLVCLMAVVLCFGFVGVKEIHAATNKVINENTGVSYNTLSEALTALGVGSAEESVTLTVDGVINETSQYITVDYAGELSIVGGVTGGDIIHATANPVLDYLPIVGQPGDFLHVIRGSITFTQNTRIKKIKDIRFCANANNGINSSHELFFYGTVEELNNIACRNGNSWYNQAGKINLCGGCKVGRIINCDIQGSQALDIRVEDQSTVDEIKDCILAKLLVEGNVGTIENISMTDDNEASWYKEAGFDVLQGGYVGTVKNSKMIQAVVAGTVDTFDGFYCCGTDDLTSSRYYGGLLITETGRVNKIIGGSIFVEVPEGSGETIINDSSYPVYLEPDLNDKDLPEGYGKYTGFIVDNSGTIVFPVSASGYLYNMIVVQGYDEWMKINHPDIIVGSSGYYDYEVNVEGYSGYLIDLFYSRASLFRGTDEYLHLKLSNTPAPVNDITVPLYKRLIQSNSAATPDMTFSFKLTQQTEWEGVQYVSAAAPIADKSITITSESQRLTQDDYMGDLTGKKLYQGEITNVLSDFTPTEAGIYVYLVEENGGNISDVTYTKSAYVLKVEVDSNLNVTGIDNIILYKDSSGKTKDQYSTPPEIFSRKNELIFYNTYGTTGGTTPTGIITNIAPFIIIGGAGITGLVLYVVINARRKAKQDAG